MWSLILLGISHAAIYYVDSAITDTYVANATPDFTTYDHVAFTETGGSDSVYKTIADVNLKAFAAGDFVYFRKGQAWREQLTVPSSGSSGSPITFGAYGSGADPILDDGLRNLIFTSATSWTTAYSTASSGEITGGSTRNTRQSIPANTSSVTGSKIRITVYCADAAGADGCVITNSTVGVMTTNGVFDAAPTTITWESAAGVTIAAGANAVSDEITFAWDKTVRYGIHHVWTKRNYKYAAVAAGFINYYMTTGTDNSATLNPTFDGNTSSQIAATLKIELYSEITNGWKTALIVEPTDVEFGGVSGTEAATLAEMDAASEWFWGSGLLYVYNVGDPSSTVQVPEGDYAILASGKSYITLSNLNLSGATTANLYVTGGAGITLSDIASTGAPKGIYLNAISGTLTGSTLSASDATTYNFHIYNSTLTAGSTVTGLTADGGGGTANVCIDTVQNLTFADSSSTNAVFGAASTGSGWLVNGSCIGVTFIRCIASGNQWDGFTIKGTGNQNTIYNKCLSINNGLAAQIGNGAGDGFTAHSNATGIQYNYCVAYGNIKAGFAFIETCAGIIYNSVAYDNGSASASARGGFVSENTGGTWTLTNNIFSENIPSEFEVTAAAHTLVTPNYNLYYHPADAQVASLDQGATYLSWADYHTTGGHEANSIYGDPLFISATDFHLQSTSPAINTGVDVGLTQDYEGNSVPAKYRAVRKPDIGAYEYQYRFTP